MRHDQTLPPADVATTPALTAEAERNRMPEVRGEVECPPSALWTPR